MWCRRTLLARYPDINRIPFNAAPSVSDGPFRFVAWRRGDRIELAGKPGFFQGKPVLKQVVIDFVPNEDSAINLLRTHGDRLHLPALDPNVA